MDGSLLAGEASSLLSEFDVTDRRIACFRLGLIDLSVAVELERRRVARERASAVSLGRDHATTHFRDRVRVDDVLGLRVLAVFVELH